MMVETKKGNTMNTLDKIYIAVMAFFYAIVIYGMNHNIKENHNNLHQIGCHVGIEDDCQWLRESE